MKHVCKKIILVWNIEYVLQFQNASYICGWIQQVIRKHVCLVAKKMILNTNYHLYLLITSLSPSKIWIFLDCPIPVPCATTRHLTCQATNTWWSTTSRPSSTRRTGWTKHTRTRPSGASWVSRCLAVADGVNCSKKGDTGKPFGKWGKHAKNVENPAVFEHDLHSCRFSTFFVCLQGHKFDLNGMEPWELVGT